MAKLNKTLCGCIGLLIVAIMTIVAFFIPTYDAHAVDRVDTINVVVYDQYPAVAVTSPGNDEVRVNSNVTVTFDYENAEWIDFTLQYEDEDGNTVEVPLPSYHPSELDPAFNYASGTGIISFDFDDYGLEYGIYRVASEAHSAIGYSEDIIEFYYVPAMAAQTGAADLTNDPIIRVDYDETVEKVEVYVYDNSGNLLFKDPIVINVPAPYAGGSEDITLPFSSYGIPSGTNYYVETIAYRTEPLVDEDGNPITDDEGNIVTGLVVIDAPHLTYRVSYTEPEAPAVPDTGRLTKALNIAKEDLLASSAIVMVFAVAVAFAVIKSTARRRIYRKYRRTRR